MLDGEGMMSVSSDSDMSMPPILRELNTGSKASLADENKRPLDNRLSKGVAVRLIRERGKS
ncbi:MAG: hypothetical protein AUI93_07145 [Crenarchaeota archaeon 13_1_40CM_3_52_10]|nr:MAG: hypothetical protein AUI93_07145 [Crenarchaeota archaeon 13_1_40CM_3_52_10]OLE91520.1 MAG: hypothetical protein AUF79_04095 [Crenarchaeota archaeon 13_1_20CM_2_51_8]